MNDSRFLFHPIQKTKQGEVLRESGQISYSCLRDLFRKKLDYLGFAVSGFGLHSLRAGGATAAANAGGLIFFLSIMADGSVKMPKMAT